MRIIISLLVVLWLGTAGAVELHELFSDNAVLQRNKPLKIFGTGKPGTTIKVSFAEHNAEAVVDEQGQWLAVLPAMAHGGPYELTVVGENTLKRTNMLVGDVWLCGGQSNMEWKLVHTIHGPEALQEVEAGKYPQIRLFQVPRKFERTLIDKKRLPGAAWALCSKPVLTHFSAIGFYFAREVNRTTGVPIGLISCNWGGTTAETWMSLEAARRIDSLKEDIAKSEKALAVSADEVKQQTAAFNAAWKQLVEKYNNPDDITAYSETSYDDQSWDTIEVPAWLQARYPEFNGMVYYRKVVDIPAEQAGKDFQLDMGQVINVDTTFFNGTKVGELGSVEPYVDKDRNQFRVYKVPGELVKTGKNVILCMVVNRAYSGGIIGNSKPRFFHNQDFKIPLSNQWRSKVICKLPPNPAMEEYFIRNMPSALYRNMVTPLAGVQLAGVIWYQGENNVQRARQYREIFPELIKDWRKLAGDPQMPFYFVQLANFGAKAPHAHWASQWAELREAQAMALALPATGMAVAIDAGDAKDIHPRNKQIIGQRLARYVLDPAKAAGPMFKSVRIADGKAEVSFDHVGSGLICKGEKLQWFALAGADKRYHWADAVISGDKVVVQSASVPNPVSVRYAWANNPEGCNLYNGDGLPAVPFRTDDY